MEESRAETNISKLLVHPQFHDTVEDMKQVKIALPPTPTTIEPELQSYAFPPNGELIEPVEDIKAYDMDAKKGCLLTSSHPIAAYDESIRGYTALEGSAFFTSHSLVLLGKDDYLPTNLLTIYFYTRSKEIVKRSKHIKYSEDPMMDSQKDYIKDKINFLVENTPENSILFIDGPLIGGDVYTYMIKAIEKFLSKEIIPIFFVKNSSSNLVTESIKSFRNRYNSDMHWAYEYLKPGQRTSFFKYADRKNPKNAKMFCYFKAHNASPQRVELHLNTMEKYKSLINPIMDLIYYLILAQGNRHNPQIRPIAIAEKYARATLSIVDFNELMYNIGVTPTMNQERFAWG